MPLKIIRQDITKIKCDAIVNPSNRYLEPGGGADLAIHKKAGQKLRDFCRKIGGCDTGKAKITPAFRLPCKYVIHTVGPDWHGSDNPRELLASCYSECLKLAVKYRCQTVAFPLISSGTNGAPKDVVLKIATRIIGDFLFENDMLVYLVVFDKDSYEISNKIYSEVASYIDDNYAEVHKEASNFNYPLFNKYRRFIEEEIIEGDFEENTGESFCSNCGESMPEEQVFCKNCGDFLKETRVDPASRCNEALKAPCPEYTSSTIDDRSVCCTAPTVSQPSLDDMIKNMDKGFADTLFHYIDMKGITDVECYKRSNVDKKTFSKIKCNKDYRPSKVTAVSFAIGLKLNLEETNHLLGTIGFCLSNSSLFDVIIQYFISSGEYESIFDVNEVLYKFDQVMLGV